MPLRGCLPLALAVPWAAHSGYWSLPTLVGDTLSRVLVLHNGDKRVAPAHPTAGFWASWVWGSFVEVVVALHWPDVPVPSVRSTILPAMLHAAPSTAHAPPGEFDPSERVLASPPPQGSAEQALMASQAVAPSCGVHPPLQACPSYCFLCQVLN